MPIEVLLNFNAEASYTALQERFAQEVADLSEVVLAHAIANLGGDYAEVAASLQMQLMNLAGQGLIDGKISTDHWQSWIAEWGSGSAMDTSNPDLSAYMGSETWNMERNGFNITGRPAGPYLGLDGQMHDDHTGALAGVNLEELSKSDSEFQAWMARVGLPQDAFQPKPALHFMRDALEANRMLIIDQLNAVIETFNFGEFFV